MYKLLLSLCLLAYSSISFSKNVLIIESYHKEYPWDASYRRAIEETLSEHNLVFFEMNTKRINPKEFVNKKNEALELFKKEKPDLVILGDDNAANLLGREIEETKTPIVFLGVNGSPREYFSFAYNNVAGVIERPLMKKSLFTLSFLLSNNEDRRKRVLIVLDDGTTSQEVAKEFANKSLVYSTDIKIESIGEWDEWKKTILSSKESGYDGLVIGLYHTIKNKGVHVPAEEVIEWTSKNTPIPLFAFWSFAVGKDKAIGGYVLDGYFHGKDGALIAKEYFDNGKFLKTGSRKGNRGSYLFNNHQLEKWNFTLPENVKREAIFVE